jgi:hypothetical protein
LQIPQIGYNRTGDLNLDVQEGFESLVGVSRLPSQIIP